MSVLKTALYAPAGRTLGQEHREYTWRVLDEDVPAESRREEATA
jgi:hypothetical protein